MAAGAVFCCGAKPPPCGAPGADPPTAASADWQPPDTCEECCCRHCNAAIPPVGTLAQTFM